MLGGSAEGVLGHLQILTVLTAVGTLHRNSCVHVCLHVKTVRACRCKFRMTLLCVFLGAPLLVISWGKMTPSGQTEELTQSPQKLGRSWVLSYLCERPGPFPHSPPAERGLHLLLVASSSRFKAFSILRPPAVPILSVIHFALSRLNTIFKNYLSTFM